MDSHWSRDPTEYQQRYYEQLRDVCEYEPKSKRGLLILRRKVGYAMHGIPDEESKCSNHHTGYSEGKYSTIKPVVDFIIRVNNEKIIQRDRLHMAIIFVSVDCGEQVLEYPLFRILLTKCTWKFVDTNCRVYSSWMDYLRFNELPKGKFCGPIKGIYSADSEGNVRLEWGLTPAAQTGPKVIGAVDKVSGVAAVASTAVSVVGLLTPLGPVMAAAAACSGVTGAYNAVRRVASLIDRGNHGQSVNPFNDFQAAVAWLSVAGGAFGAAAGAATSRAATLARNGEVMSRAGRVTCNALNVTSLAINAAGVSFGTYSLAERIHDGEATPLEVFQFTASLLFFTHTMANFRTASQIIKETQRGVINDFEKSLRSKEHKKEFKKLAKNTAASGENALDGRAKVIRGIRRIENKDDFFDAMVRTEKDFNEHKVIFSENGNIIVNGGAEIHPTKLYELGDHQRREFLSLAKQASEGTISDAAFRARFESVLSSNAAGSSGRKTSLNNYVKEAVKTLTSKLQQGISGITIGKRDVLIMLSVVDELTVLVCSKTDNKYAKWWQLIFHHVTKLVTEMCVTYNEAQNLAKHFPSLKDKRRFDLRQGVETANVFIQFVNKVYEQYKNHIDKLKRDIEKLNVNENLMAKHEICPRCKMVM